MKKPAFALLLALTACGGKSGPTAPAPAAEAPSPKPSAANAGSEPASALERWLKAQREASVGRLQAHAVAEEPEVALAAARAALEETFWSEAPWPTLPEAEATLTARPSLFDEVQVSRTEIDDRHVAFVSTEVAPIADAAQTWLMTTGDALPEGGESFAMAMREASHRAWWSEARARLCARLAAQGLSEACPKPDTAAARAALRQLGDGLVLESVYRDGIPVELSGTPARALEILVTWTDGASDPVPIEGIPLRVTEGTQWLSPAVDGEVLAGGETSDDAEPAPPPSARSARDGVARFELAKRPEDLGARLGIALDREALLGSFAEAFPELVLSVPFRRVTAANASLALAVDEESPSDESAHLAEALQRGLAQSRSVVLLSEDERTLFEDGVSPQALDRFARQTRGRVDVVVRGEAQSQLTSRMGSRSVYHEATARLVLYDVWTGRQLATLERSQQALGLGEARAAENALRELGASLVDEVEGALKRPVAAR